VKAAGSKVDDLISAPSCHQGEACLDYTDIERRLGDSFPAHEPQLLDQMRLNRKGGGSGLRLVV
jgi:hypothetical protein